jgi:hypothetical protein
MITKGSFLKNTEVPRRTFGVCFSPWKNWCINLDKNGLGDILGTFLRTHLVTLLKTETITLTISANANIRNLASSQGLAGVAALASAAGNKNVSLGKLNGCCVHMYICTFAHMYICEWFSVILSLSKSNGSLVKTIFYPYIQLF